MEKIKIISVDNSGNNKMVAVINDLMFEYFEQLEKSLKK